MRYLNKLHLMVLTVAVAAMIGAPVLAFHDEGVAHCNGCHTMHNSQDGALVDPDSPGGNAFLLNDATASDVCLSCHASGLGAVLSGPAFDPLAPAPELGAGNFVFLLEDNLNDAHGGATDPVSGDAAGHNLDAPGFGLATDGTLTLSPGGSFPASQMSCSSCHDPHGTAAFRLLYGAGRLVQNFYSFPNPAPLADGLALFGAPESAANHTAYKADASGWCGNCHGNFHDAGTTLKHPSDSTLGGSIATAYGLYNGTAQYQTGNPALSYLPQVPFEDLLNTTASTTGPSAGSVVMCLTCHRAHGSSAMDAGRWDFNVTVLSEDGDESGSYEMPDPYSDPGNQRSLCNKCHVQDEFDLGSAP